MSGKDKSVHAIKQPSINETYPTSQVKNTKCVINQHKRFPFSNFFEVVFR